MAVGERNKLMPEFLPSFRVTDLFGAEAGALMRVPHGSNSLLAFAADKRENNRLIVILELDHPHEKLPAVDPWQNEQGCLSYGSEFILDICHEKANVALSGSSLSNSYGVLVACDDRLLIRVRQFGSFSTGPAYYDLREGVMATDHISNDRCSFLRWSIRLKSADPLRFQTVWSFDANEVAS